MENKKCELCNNSFEFNPKRKREREKRFCSTICSRSFNGKRNKGKKRTDEVKLKMSTDRKGDDNNFFGKTHSDETKEIIKSNALDRAQTNKKTVDLSGYEYEVLDGMMLADASIGDASSISARISYGCKFEETLIDIKNELSSIKFGNQFSYTSKPHKKSGKCYTSWFLNSSKNNTLLLERERWYPEDKKIVPKDIRITHNSCYWWFIGDGYVTSGKVSLCTESFTKEHNEQLVEKLKELGFTSSVTSRNRISMYKESSVRFMEWICKSRIVADQYKYKWENFKKQING